MDKNCLLKVCRAKSTPMTTFRFFDIVDVESELPADPDVAKRAIGNDPLDCSRRDAPPFGQRLEAQERAIFGGRALCRLTRHVRKPRLQIGRGCWHAIDGLPRGQERGSAQQGSYPERQVQDRRFDVDAGTSRSCRRGTAAATRGIRAGVTGVDLQRARGVCLEISFDQRFEVRLHRR